MNKFLAGRVNDAFVDKYVQNFSVFRWGDDLGQTATTIAESGAFHFVPGGVPYVLGGQVINSSTTLIGIGSGMLLQYIGEGLMKFAGAIGFGATVGASFADIVAFAMCSGGG
jgi:hypothetical protein